MTVSAFWHGIHPGYYLSFLTIPPNLVAEELMASAFRARPSTPYDPQSPPVASATSSAPATQDRAEPSSTPAAQELSPTPGTPAGNSRHARFQLDPAMFDWICWFFKMRSFDYMCMGFILLGWRETLRYWYSIYFIVHVYVVVFIAVGLTFKPRRVRGNPTKAT